MIVLDNFSKVNKYIIITKNEYKVVSEDDTDEIECGVGGITDSNNLLGVFYENDKIYFQYNENRYEFNINNIECTNEVSINKKRHFVVSIDKNIVCSIEYIPYINPIALPLGEEDDEFDLYAHIYNILKDKEHITKFVTGIKNLQSFYRNM